MISHCRSCGLEKAGMFWFLGTILKLSCDLEYFHEESVCVCVRERPQGSFLVCTDAADALSVCVMRLNE